MRIPQATIQQVLANINIVDVIGQYVNLRVKGKNHWGLCPFHSEKTPSFSVTEAKQIYHCFGCHNGGNVFKFLMEYKKISYTEAIIELAGTLGITIRYDDREQEKETSEIDELFDLNEDIGKLFAQNLFDTQTGQYPMEYLTKRGMKHATIRSFGIGYSPQSRTYLHEYLSPSPRKVELALKLGLLGKNENGRIYDRFAGRIIFPIFTTNGRIVAFAGRVIEKTEYSGKYVNSPESLIYSKGKILYGLSHGKDEIRKNGSAIVVEGYMDLISLYQNDIKNVIAVSGTALTDDQAMLLSRYTKDVILLFDADEAGVKASMRSVEILLKKNLNIKIASLPPGEDPDSYIQKNSKDDFLFHISKAPDFLEFQTAFYERNGSLRDPMKSADVIRDLLRPLALLDDAIKQSRLLTSLAQKFSLSERLLQTELEKIINRNRAPERIPLPPPPPAGRATVESRPEKSPDPARTLVEKHIIKALLEGEFEIVGFVKKHISPEDIDTKLYKELMTVYYDLHTDDLEVTPGAVADAIKDNDLLQKYTEMISEPYSTSDIWEESYPAPERNVRLRQFALDVVKNYKTYLIDKEIEELKSLIKLYPDNTLKYLERNIELQKNKAAVEAQFRSFEKQAE